MVCWMYLWFESMKEMAMRSQSWLCSLTAWLHIVILLDMEFYTCFFRGSMQCVAGLLFVVLDLFIFSTYVVLKYWLDGSGVQFVNSWAGWLMMKQIFDHYTLIITRLSNSHFLYSGNRCHQWNKWDYNYLWSGIYCSIHIHSVPWLTIWHSTLVLLHMMHMCIHFFPQSNARRIATFQFTVYSHNLWCIYMINVLMINF